MNIKLYTIKDTKAEAYLPPFSFRTDGEAIRAFDDSVNKPGTPIHDHPEDFCLFYIGEFNQVKGLLIPANCPRSLGCANDFVKPNKE